MINVLKKLFEEKWFKKKIFILTGSILIIMTILGNDFNKEIIPYIFYFFLFLWCLKTYKNCEFKNGTIENSIHSWYLDRYNYLIFSIKDHFSTLKRTFIVSKLFDLFAIIFLIIFNPFIIGILWFLKIITIVILIKIMEQIWQYLFK